METVTNVIVILIVAAVIGAICFYLHRQKKKGVKCIGCPYASQCSGNCNGGCGNADSDDTEQK